ncbi:hypothetical protein CYY_003341 [Polysphondylium violaceum]|uniref:Importin N-terminal domain-containing protein n=1 Tax=Polysphondylium violaceum TaxID=133409 RepID=A0A8J4PXV8_9MYCE|nr:hypothetical protein CYY_003341 [Polysphondylium violaceum]
MDWVPNQEGLTQLVYILSQSNQGSGEVQDKIRQDLEKFNSIPDYNNYLVVIFNNRELPADIRSVAGLLLKTNIKTYYEKMPREVQAYIKREILPNLSDSSQSVRRTIANIITTLIVKSSFKEWPDLLNILLQALDSPNENLVDGALLALQLICEDSTESIDYEARPALNSLIPKLILFFKSNNPSFRRRALVTISFFITSKPGALLVNMDAFLRGVFSLSDDPSAEVRKHVCKTLVTLVETRIEFLLPFIKDVVKYMLHASKDTNEEVAIESTEFWAALSQSEHHCREVLLEFLPTLIPVLLNGMVYTEAEYSVLDHGDDSMTPDRPEDIKPFFSSGKVHGTGQQLEGGFVQQEQQQQQQNNIQQQQQQEDDEEDDDDDDDLDWVDDVWTIRKGSAFALDVLSSIFDCNTYLTITLPLIEQRMAENNPWPIRESAILALGAIADGCKEGLIPHLSKVVPYLTNTLNDPKPLVRSITCWTLSRYGRWIANEGKDLCLHSVIINLLNRILDNNKTVQEAACSAFASIEDEADRLLVPYLSHILPTFVSAFSRYQAKNLLILYDAISTLAKVVGPELNKPEYINILIPPLLEKFNTLDDSSRALLPLLGCLNQVCSAIGVGLQNLIVIFYNRAMKLLESSLQDQYRYMQDPKSYDKPEYEFIVSALDLLQGLTEGVGTSIESLVSNSKLPLLLLECMKIQAFDVLQSAFALLGDMSKVCIIHFKQYIHEYLKILNNNLVPEFLSVCNNAIWAVGEIAIRMSDEVKPFVPNIVEKLTTIINKINLNPNLLENSAVTLGRLGQVDAPTIAPLIGNFIQSWCMIIRRKVDDAEKDSAFRGMWMLISSNPNGSLKDLVYICDAVASWGDDMQPDLHEAYSNLLLMYKKALGDVWPQYYSQFPQQLRTILNQKFKLDNN